ncbi:MAG: hypothetical protein EOO56_03135 [Hymenobacter sp.]|nr:MAG: hypothetical protein EOO56_03135 [Hymenobacter sp.]
MQNPLQTTLYNALVLNGEMSLALYAHELREHVAYWRKGMRRDKDDFLVVVTEHSGDVAMLFITKKGELFINEDARQQLQLAWPAPGIYFANMLRLIPSMAQQLASGEIWVTGVKIQR